MANVLGTVVRVRLHAAADVAGNRPDDVLGPLRFTTLRPANSAATRSWLRTVDYVTTSLRTNPDAMRQPLIATVNTRLLAASLLTAFPNTWTADPVDRTDASPTSLSRAITFIETHGGLDIGVLDIAGAAHASARAVQLAFPRHLDTTPMAYLRRIWLDQQLRANTRGDGSTVTDVAAHWGFANPGRFAVLHRQVSGQPPCHTLAN